MSRTRTDFEGEEFEQESPLRKKRRLGKPVDDDGYTSSGCGNGHDEVGGGSTFAMNDDDDFDDGGGDAAGCGGGDGIKSPDAFGVGGGGNTAGRKNKTKPWKVHASRGVGRMHDANLYRHYRPDFRELAREYPDTFGPHVRADPDTGRAAIDWTDPAAMRELTRVMLRHDFGLLEWDAPLDRLCPPVANRLNYICWLSDLMKLSPSARLSSAQPSPAVSEKAAVGSRGGGGENVEGRGAAEMSTAERNLFLFGMAGGLETEGKDMAVCDDRDDMDQSEAAGGPGRPCKGVDIGTGASCIYPLLGAKVAGWSFLATEIDPVSAEWAEKNVRSNGLEGQVTVRLVPSPANNDGDEAEPGPLLAALRDEDGDFDFSMTNPPFFESADEAGQNPDTATGDMAAAGEVACPGGEAAFVRAIIRDSLQLGERVRWYTSMVGKKANAKKLLRILRESGVKNTRTTEFFQGRTVRWGIAWSFTSEGMVGDKVPDDPSVKVFSKKKAAGRSQHDLRSFSVPLRPRPRPPPPPSSSSPLAATTSSSDTPSDQAHRGEGGSSGGGGGGSQPPVKITVPANLPSDAGDVVERLKSSLMAFKQADIKVDAVEEDDFAVNPASASGPRRFRCVAYPRSPVVDDRGGGGTTARAAESSTATAAPATTTAASAARPIISTAVPPLFAFELEVHCAAEWAGAAAAQAAIQVWARLEEGGDRGAFQRLWEVVQMDVLRQNRRWRRETTRENRDQGRRRKEMDEA